MSKEKFLAKIAALYRVATASDNFILAKREEWTKPEMAAVVCSALDDALRGMFECGAITADEKQAFYDLL